MGEKAASGLLWLANGWQEEIPQAVVSGIIGDALHYYGYHRSRNRLVANGYTQDYSVLLMPDHLGDGDNACALDMSMPPAQMRMVSSRLLASGRDVNDPRLDKWREFYGTVDGENVIGWDFYNYAEVTSDDSHLWHVHLSVLREFADDMGAMADMLSVISGETVDQWRHKNQPTPSPITDTEDEDMAPISVDLTKDHPVACIQIGPVNRGSAANGSAWLNLGASFLGETTPGTERKVQVRVAVSTDDPNKPGKILYRVVFRSVSDSSVVPWSPDGPEGKPELPDGCRRIDVSVDPKDLAAGGHVTACVEFGRPAK